MSEDEDWWGTSSSLQNISGGKTILLDRESRKKNEKAPGGEKIYWRPLQGSGQLARG